jgi:hypothetical protein
MVLESIQPLVKMSTRYIYWGPRRPADNLITFMCRMLWKSGSLNLLEPSGPHRVCYGTSSKSKSPVTTHEDSGREGEMLGFRPCVDIRHNLGGKVVSSMLRPHFNPKKISWFSLRWSGFRCNRTWTIRIGHLKISKEPTGNQTRNLPSCGAVPQATAPLRVPGG